ncbi:DNA cross-link repair protein PSO2/SNM1 [Balamuthia mandrillaris]
MSSSSSSSSSGRLGFNGVLPHTAIVVDNFKVRAGVKAYFLTHFHADHYLGLSDSWNNGPIYCTFQTRELALQRFPKLERGLFRPLAYHTPHMLTFYEEEEEEEEEASVCVTLLPANHCPGDAMYVRLLLEGPFGVYLHTGDLRYEPSMQEEPALRRIVGQVDRLFLDTTFCSPFWTLPTKEAAIEQVLQIMRKHPPDMRVYLECEMLGTELIFKAVAQEFNTQVCVDERLYAVLCLLPDQQQYITTDASSTRFHACQVQTFAKKGAKASSSALYIKPSTQWFGIPGNGLHDTSLYCEQPCFANGVWHVLYSIHSSFSELQELVAFLRPKAIVPTVACSTALLRTYFGKSLSRSSSQLNDITITSTFSSFSSSSAFSKETCTFTSTTTTTSNNNTGLRRSQHHQANAPVKEAEAHAPQRLPCRTEKNEEKEDKERRQSLFLEALGSVELDVCGTAAEVHSSTNSNAPTRPHKRTRRSIGEGEEDDLLHQTATLTTSK